MPVQSNNRSCKDKEKWIHRKNMTQSNVNVVHHKRDKIKCSGNKKEKLILLGIFLHFEEQIQTRSKKKQCRDWRFNKECNDKIIPPAFLRIHSQQVCRMSR